MRLWSLHPKYLDPKGLVALWREALLAQAVLRGNTRGYLNHPQLLRFRQQASPLSVIASYLVAIHSEAQNRGYSFNLSKVGPVQPLSIFPVSSGQVEFERQHLLSKLAVRSPSFYSQLSLVPSPETHPIFEIITGGIESWERR
jgi:hypothetical protein